ncbi:PTS system mannose/fructose/sorbose family transporter subunit IID [Collinsella ureilytica]|uniref:PTS system mannose/fructose/sorbose family transporter subunit IID n=1 Tax=Collinsella ureilytica TaxID=2869515 RepID=UPI0027D2711A|nr:PTS system mannose/fructose/sorbose family transporter subunit IID [Collinsella urealyticum]
MNQISLRSLLLFQAGWNYERMQSSGYLWVMLPTLRKIYGDNTPELKEMARLHCSTFFNTTNFLNNIVHGIDLALEVENGIESKDAVAGMKTGLMGSLASIGDSIFGALLYLCLAAMLHSRENFMPDMQPLLIVAAILMIVVMLASETIKRLLDAALERLLAEGKYDMAIQVLDKRLARMLFPTFKQYYLRFSIYEASGQARLARTMLNHLLGMKVTARRRATLVVIAFNFFINQEDEPAARAMLEEIERVGTEEVLADCKDTYAIVFEGDSSHIERMEGLVARVKNTQVLCKLYYLLARQYKNRGDKKMARAFEAKLNALKAEAREQA